jgi:hypothetical protein
MRKDHIKRSSGKFFEFFFVFCSFFNFDPYPPFFSLHNLNKKEIEKYDWMTPRDICYEPNGFSLNAVG